MYGSHVIPDYSPRVSRLLWFLIPAAVCAAWGYADHLLNQIGRKVRP